MTEKPYPPLQITEHWADLTDHLIEIVDQIPEDKLDWSPRPELWNFRGILLHIVMARVRWLEDSIRDGEGAPDYIQASQSKKGLQEQLRLSWERMARFLSDEEKLSAEYGLPPDEPAYIDPPKFDGHWIAYHRLVHDLQHRGDILSRSPWHRAAGGPASPTVLASTRTRSP